MDSFEDLEQRASVTEIQEAYDEMDVSPRTQSINMEMPMNMDSGCLLLSGSWDPLKAPVALPTILTWEIPYPDQLFRKIATEYKNHKH